MAVGRFELQGDGSLVRLTGRAVFKGYDDNGDAILEPIAIRSLPDPYVPTVPSAPSATGVMLTRTSAKIDWVPGGVSPGSAPVTGWRVFKDGVQQGADLPASTLTLTLTGLAVDTPEIIYAFVVRGISDDGVGDSSNTVSLQWAGTPVSMPTAPTGLTRGVLSATQVTLSWAETADATVDKHGLFEGSVLVRDSISASALAYTYSGLTPGSVHNNVNIRRHNSAGWSPASNTLNFTMLTGSGVIQDICPGVDTTGVEPTYFTDWPSTRIYRINDVINGFDLTTPRIIAVTDDQNVSRSSLASGATAVRNMLINFYEGAGSAARQDCEIHWANGNEVDREFTSGSLPANVIETWRLMYNVIHEESSPGVRRFPKASMWVDMTTFQITSAGAGARFKAIAPYIDGVAASYYPPGRQADPVVFTSYDQYALPIFEMAADWRASNPQITMMACWEIGSPIDHALDTGGPNSGGTTNWSIRPRYFAGGRASGPTAVSTIQPMGSNYEGFLNYFYRKCVEMNFISKEVLYWNRQSNPDIPNPWKHDRNPTAQTVSIDTATAWHNWTPGSRLPDL